MAPQASTERLASNGSVRHSAMSAENENDRPMLGKNENDRPMLGKTENDRPMLGKTENDRPMLGKTENDRPMLGKTENDHPMLGKPFGVQEVTCYHVRGQQSETSYLPFQAVV